MMLKYQTPYPIYDLNLSLEAQNGFHLKLANGLHYEDPYIIVSTLAIPLLQSQLRGVGHRQASASACVESWGVVDVQVDFT